jgi:glucose/arabinose dehydrogenase
MSEDKEDCDSLNCAFDKDKKNTKKVNNQLIGIIVVIGIIISILIIPPIISSRRSYDVQNAFPNLSFDQPLYITHSGDSSNNLYVVSQRGEIFVFDNSENASEKQIFLDIKTKVLFDGEQGLLGLAFHPDFESNGFFYINYVADSPKRTVISKWSIDSGDVTKANSSSEEIILTFPQPHANHNGGHLDFGSDGFLYISVGDGGGFGDPNNNAQNKSNLYGSILRIDVDSGSHYGIPSDNPFAGNIDGFKEEIYAYGLRNPWRFSFDGDVIYAGDVGQQLWEEIDVIEKGKNYGWNIREGSHFYSSGDAEGLVDPIWEYNHITGGDAVTGGYVYRGNRLAALKGRYICGDYARGKVWALTNTSNVFVDSLLFDADILITSFGLDQHDELYICSAFGTIYKIIKK